MTEPDMIRQAVSDYVKYVGESAPDKVFGLFADGATVEDPIGTEIKTGSAIHDFYAGIATMDRCESQLNWVRVAGDTAVFEFDLVTETGGLTFKVTPIDIMTFDAQGKIASMRAVWTSEDLQQL